VKRAAYIVLAGSFLWIFDRSTTFADATTTRTIESGQCMDGRIRNDASFVGSGLRAGHCVRRAGIPLADARRVAHRRSRMLYVCGTPLVPSKLGPARRSHHIGDQLSRFYDVTLTDDIAASRVGNAGRQHEWQTHVASTVQGAMARADDGAHVIVRRAATAAPSVTSGPW
jgi:hypothetical protein